MQYGPTTDLLIIGASIMTMMKVTSQDTCKRHGEPRRHELKVCPQVGAASREGEGKRCHRQMYASDLSFAALGLINCGVEGKSWINQTRPQLHHNGKKRGRTSPTADISKPHVASTAATTNHHAHTDCNVHCS